MRRIACIILSLVASPAAAAKSHGNSDITKDGFPNIKSASALVLDLSTDAVLYEKDADEVRPIASISKLFGALVLLEECKLEPDGLHEMDKSNRLAARGGDKSKLTTGWSYTHKDLLHAALMRSDNRALPALAEACGFEPDKFAEHMTAKAKKLGLTKTSFKEPDGLSADNVSTAREVMVALRAAIKLPQLTEIMEKADYVITAHKGDRTRPIKIKNTDRLLSKNLAQILGGKTGYTDIARYCLAVAARTFEGKDVGMVFLGAEGRYTRFADFTRVIKWIGTDEGKARIASTPATKPGYSAIPLVVPAQALALPVTITGAAQPTPPTIGAEPPKVVPAAATGPGTAAAAPLAPATLAPAAPGTVTSGATTPVKSEPEQDTE